MNNQELSESKSDSALDLVFLMGTILLENGAEISRVQDTMERVAAAYHIDEVGHYVITNGIFANGVENGVSSHTLIKYVKSGSINFARIAAVNELSREICTGSVSVSEGIQRCREIKEMPVTSNLVMTIASAVGCGGFCYIFGGTYRDVICSALIGMLMQLFLSFGEKHKVGNITVNVLCSMFAAVAAIALVKTGVGLRLENIIAGAVIRLVPGVSLTNGIRDLFNSDYLSGTIRIIDAAIIGVCIAIGVGIVFKLASLVALI